MKTPNKIYVCIPQRLNLSTFKEDSKYVGMAYNDKGNLKSPQIEEYIRKNALLEWVKEQAKHFSARSDELEVIDPTNPDVIFFDGKHAAFTEMIKRIELL